MGTLFVGIIITVMVLLIIGAVVFFKLCYIDVPQSSVLVIDNKTVSFTGRLVLPYQKKQIISIAPVQIKTAYLGKKGLYSNDHLLMDVVISYVLCVDSTPASVLTAINTIGCEQIADSNAVNLALMKVLGETVKELTKQYDYELLDKDRGKLRKALMVVLTNKLLAYGFSLTFINIDKIELMPLLKLAQEDSALAKEQEAVRFEWDKQQKQLLEKRLKLVLNQQRELSLKIKKMIEDYQIVISKKITFFLNREIVK